MRRTVLPVLRLLVWAVIAACLVYLAFFRGLQGEPSDAAVPGVDLTVPEVAVARSTVENTVVLTGTVVADPALTVRSTSSGVVSRLRAAVGQPVAAGDGLFDVRVTTERDPVTAADGTVSQPPPRVETVAVTAPAGGAVETLTPLVGQDVTIGQDVATIGPGTLTVQAPLRQDQQFRLLAPPSAAQVTVPGGPAPFECAEVRTGISDGEASVAQVDPFSGMVVPPTTGASVTCRVPAGVPAFAGLTAEMSLQAGVSTDVLVLPVTAVRGSVSTGVVWVLADDGTSTETPVTLGLTDGEQVEVTGGVAEGARVLQFVPGLEDASIVGQYGG